jgi:hypothetical protein
MGIVAWTRGEDRAEVQQHERGLSQILVRTFGSVYLYQGPLGEEPEKHRLFKGSDRQVQFVSQTPAFPSTVRAAFTAVVIGLEDDVQGRALVVRQRILPNREPFTKATVVLRDPTIQGLQFGYLDPEGGWTESWDADDVKKLPAAIRIRLSTMKQDRLQPWPLITVSIHTQGVIQ